MLYAMIMVNLTKQGDYNEKSIITFSSSINNDYGGWRHRASGSTSSRESLTGSGAEQLKFITKQWITKTGCTWYMEMPVVGNSNDFFDRRSSAADAGLQLRVSNKDVIGGFGFGAELTALSTLNLVKYGVVTASMQSVLAVMVQYVGKPILDGNEL